LHEPLSISRCRLRGEPVAPFTTTCTYSYNTQEDSASLLPFRKSRARGAGGAVSCGASRQVVALASRPTPAPPVVDHPPRPTQYCVPLQYPLHETMPWLRWSMPSVSHIVRRMLNARHCAAWCRLHGVCLRVVRLRLCCIFATVRLCSVAAADIFAALTPGHSSGSPLPAASGCTSRASASAPSDPRTSRAAARRSRRAHRTRARGGPSCCTPDHDEEGDDVAPPVAGWRRTKQTSKQASKQTNKALYC
jgi:hypothetical protein